MCLQFSKNWFPTRSHSPGLGTAPGTPRLRHSWWKVLFAPIPIPSALDPSLLGHIKTIHKRKPLMFISSNTVITSSARTVLSDLCSKSDSKILIFIKLSWKTHFFFPSSKVNSHSGKSLNKQLGVRMNLCPLGGKKKTHHKPPQYLQRYLLTQQLSETWWVFFFF